MSCSFSFAKSQIKRLSPSSAAFLIGQPGIGKTQFVEQLSVELGLKLVKLRCAESADTGDLIGVLVEKDGVHFHTRPKWLSDNDKVLLFLDEINRAKKDVINAIMQLCTSEQEFNGFKLVPGSRVICAMNSSKFATNDVDELNRALFSRGCRIEIEPNKEDWLAWANTHGIHPDIIEYIDSNDISHLFNMTDVVDNEDDDTVNPRAWENFSMMYSNGISNGDYAADNTLVKMDAASWLGAKEAAHFYSWLVSNRIFNATGYLLETNQTKVIARATAVSKMLDTYKARICDNVMSTAISLLSNQAELSKFRCIVHNLYTLMDRLDVEQASYMYTKYIQKYLVKTDLKPDWLDRLMHTDEAIWSKMKTIIQGNKKG